MRRATWSGGPPRSRRRGNEYQVERQLRWLKRLGALAIAVGAVVVLVAQAKEKKPQDLVVRSLTIKEGEQVRVRLDSWDGMSSLTLAGTDGRTRVHLFAMADETAGLLLMDKVGRERAKLAVMSGEHPRLSLSDKDQQSRAVLRLMQDGEPTLQLSNKFERPLAVLGRAGIRDWKTGKWTVIGANCLTLFDSDRWKVGWQASGDLDPAPEDGIHVIIAHAQMQCRNYHAKASRWRLEKNEWPESLKAMEAPLLPGEEDFSVVINDPWGNPYVLERVGNTIRVWSWGPDGQQGTDDDICDPPPEKK
jgi:hypothetical protein